MLRSSRWIACIFFLTFFFVLMPSFVCSQDGSTGAIRGVVVDPDGRPIAAANNCPGEFDNRHSLRGNFR